MSPNNGDYSLRVLGQFPLSIATSLAFESLINIHPDTKHRGVPIYDFKEIWINISTLVRNYIGASDKKLLMTNLTKKMKEIVLDIGREIAFIAEFCSIEGKGIKPIFYFSRYEGIDKEHPNAVLRKPNTDKQIEGKKLHDRIVEQLLLTINKPERPLDNPFRIKVYRNKITDRGGLSSLILTHMTYDLLSIANFNKLTLIESHTGALKPRMQWYTKLTHGSKLVNFPFNENIMLIFGDKETFHPIASKYREAVLNLANEMKWTSVTSNNKVANDIARIKDKEVRDFILKTLE